MTPDADAGAAGRHLVPLAVIVGAVVLANFAVVTHLVTTNPLSLFGGVSQVGGAALPGFPFIDPNSGYLSQAVGHLAASDWLHGHVPWWNPYEGVGTPLVAEGQNSAFFPGVLLLGWSQGYLALRLILEVLAGGSTYFLVRRLGAGRSAATGCGVAYGLCGTFAWFGANWAQVMPFLPLALLGVEQAKDAALGRGPRGWRLLALALGVSIVAGFPETAFIDGILVALWALARLVALEPYARRAFVTKVAAGGVVAVALAAPFEVAFAGYLPHGFVGGHNGGFAKVSLAPGGMAQLVLPYGFGPIFAFHSAHGPDTISRQWGSVGGYLGVTLLFTGLLGILGARRGPHRALRLTLAAWVVLCLLRSYGFAPVVDAMAPLPGLHQSAFYRYDNASWTLAMVVLGGLGIDDIVRGRAPRQRVLVAFALSAGATAWAGVEAWHVMGGAAGPGSPHRYVLVSVVGAGALLAVTGAAALVGAAPFRLARPDEPGMARRGLAVAAGIVLAVGTGAEAATLLGMTQLSAPARVITTSGAGVWLARHLGTERFATLGPVQPNYGSYFGAAEVNTNDLPFPKAWQRYVSTRLDPNAPQLTFTGGSRIDPGGPSPAEELAARVTAYEAVGVRYVVEPASGTDVQDKPFPPPGARRWPSGPRRVYRDDYAAIWELPAPAPLFSAQTSAGGRPCAVRAEGWDAAVVSCPAPGTLVRRVLDLPDWSAGVDGRAVPLRPAGPDSLFQQLPVPAGTTRATFSYWPAHERPAIAVAGAALVLLLAPLLARPPRRGRDALDDREAQDVDPTPAAPPD